MKKLLLGVVILSGLLLSAGAADKKIVLVAGSPSHGRGDHEFRAGCLLLQECLRGVPGVTTVVASNGWPADPAIFDDAAAIVIYADGGPGHPFIKPDRLQRIGALMKKGVGMGALHYGVEVPKEKGGPEFLDWIG